MRSDADRGGPGRERVYKYGQDKSVLDGDGDGIGQEEERDMGWQVVNLGASQGS